MNQLMMAADKSALFQMSQAEACAHMVEMFLTYRTYCRQHGLDSIADLIEKTVLEVVTKQYESQPQKQFDMLAEVTKEIGSAT